MVFKSKVDTWLLLVLIGSILLPAVLISPELAAMSLSDKIFALGVFLLCIAIPVWLFCDTRYSVDGGMLQVRSGPFRWRIEIASITSVTESRSPMSGPALSLDRLKITYANGQSLLISPRNKQDFLASIGF